MLVSVNITINIRELEKLEQTIKHMVDDDRLLTKFPGSLHLANAESVVWLMTG